MSRIDDLIAKYCPNGVEMDAVGNLCKINRGRVMSKDYLVQNAGSYPVYSSQTANEGMLGKIKTYDYDGEYLTWTTDGAYAGAVFHRKGKFSITNICGLLDLQTDKLLIRFLYYYLGGVTKRYVNTGMGNPKLMSNVMQKIQVAIPPMPVQEEIVRTLDSFAELEARKKQYEHYREELLNPVNMKGVVRSMTIKDIIKDSFWIMPATPEYIPEGVPYITSKNIGNGKISFADTKYISEEAYRSVSSKRPIMPNDILISMIGTLGNVAIVTKEDGEFYGQNMYLLRLNEAIVSRKYFFYFFNSMKIKSYLGSIKNNSGQGYLKTQHIEGIQIPVPPLAEQERIVGILDKFDALVNDISVGLPAELNARRQQYEHYRNRLLNFEPMGVSA